MSLWESINRVLVVLDKSYIGQFENIKMKFNEFGLNVNTAVFLSENPDSLTVINKNGLHLTSKKTLGYFGKVKDENLKKSLDTQFDSLLIIGDVSTVNTKLIKKVKIQNRIGVNTNYDSLTINLNTNKKEPSEILSFVRNTLKQIQ